MTATVHLATITAAIANLSITGLTVFDVGVVVDQLDGRSAYLFPDPKGFFTEALITHVTTGGNTAEMDLNYKLNYVFTYKNREAGRRLSEHVAAMVAMASEIIGTLATTDFSASGAMTFDVSCPFLGLVEDPAGNVYHGGMIAIQVQEFLQ